MKRKIFSKLLMGAFLIASISSFVSCKDYDDDIKVINDKLATVALQTTVDNLQSQLQSAAAAAAAAQKTADQAVAAAAAAQATANDAATKAALATVEATAKAAGEEAAKAITNAATAQTAAEAAQKTADQAAEAAKAAQEAADKAAAAAAAGTDAAKADAAAAAAAAAAAQKVAEEAAAAAAKAASDNKSATDAAAEVAQAAKAAADDVTAKIATLATQVATAQSTAEAAQKAAEAAQKAADLAAGKEVDLSNYVTKADLTAALKDYAKAVNDYVTNDKLNEALTPIKEQLEKVNKDLEKIEVLGDLAAFKQKVDNYEASIKELYSAVTSISLYQMMDRDNDGTLETGGNSAFRVNLRLGRVDRTHAHFTTVKLDGDWNLTTADVTVANNQYGDATFGKNDYYQEQGQGVASATNRTVSFNHGDYVRPTASVIVRVSPTGANLTPANLKFMDTKGQDLSSVIEITNVSAYNPTTAVTRATSNNGLFTVTFRLKDGVTNNTLQGQTLTNTGGEKLYCLAANNTAKAEGRYVVSEYDLSFPATAAYVPTSSLETAGYLRIGSDNTTRSFFNTVKGRTNTTAAGKGYNDYYWTAAAGNGVTKSANRTALGAYAVNNGQAFRVYAPGVKYLYVIRDDKNANLENDASELNAWATYTYEGLNTLVDGTYATIKVTIPNGSILGDEVAFRLFAVNEDGTLADPDGVPFTVFVGNEIKEAQVIGSFHATKEYGLVKVFDVTGGIESNRGFAAVEATALPLRVNNAVVNTPATVTWLRDATNNARNWAEVKKVRVQFGAIGAAIAGTNSNVNSMSQWPNGATATGQIAFTSGTPATQDFTVKFSLTKELPTAADVADLWSWKAGQLEGNTWKAVIYPETAATQANASTVGTWTALRTSGYKGVNNGVNGLVDNTPALMTPHNTDELDGSFVFTFANSRWNGNNAYSWDAWVGDWTGLVNNMPYVDGYILDITGGTQNAIRDLIDNSTAHASTINYNFGVVSSANFDENVISGAKTFNDYIVNLQNFSTVYACPFHQLNVNIVKYADGRKLNASANGVIAAGDQDWNYVYYNDPAIGKGMYNTATVAGGNTLWGDYSGQLATKGITITSGLGAEFVTGTFANLCRHLVPNDAAGTGIKAEFISDETQHEDYFTATVSNAGVITLTRISGTQDPRRNIPSTLKITARCAFNHNHVINIPFTVKTLAE